ncbi:tetratricopeptide repeat protein [Croceicoccus ponticola]|nr:tetratricopeptide repeat protein [Croceicoccus ponticola]
MLLAPFLCVLLVAATEHVLEPEETGSSQALPQPDDLAIRAFGPADYGSATKAYADEIALGRERVNKAPGEWLREETLAAALLSDFSLSGNYATLSEAGSWLRNARNLAPEGSGPWLREAAFAMVNHDLAGAEAALAGAERVAVPNPASDQAEIAAMRGDIALYRGDMDAAERFYAIAEGTSASSTAFRRAALARSQGRFDAAMALFAKAARDGGGTPLSQARIALQLGITESARGRYDAARNWYDSALRLFPDYPLARLYRAETFALAGDTKTAIAEMEAVARREQWPDAMDALAMLYRTQGDRVRSRQWSARAGALWQQRLQLAPSAARAHAAEHELVFGDPQRALALARQDVAMRPHGASRILLANALLATGATDEALTQLRKAEASGWRSAPLYASIAEAALLLGDVATAEQATLHAEALNPEIFQPSRTVVWFGHG